MEFSIEGEEVSHSPKTEEKKNQEHHQDKVEYQFAQQRTAQPDYSQKAEQEPQNQSCTRFCSIAFYEKFFQVSQGEVVERLKLSFIPIKKQFIQKSRDNPDFYGPFWILTTIIFLLGSTGNLARYFYNFEKTEYIFKLELVRYGVILVYTFGFGVPGLLYLVLKFLKCTTLSLPQLICIYGYSFGCFILVFLLCIIPVPWLHWLLMIYGMANSIAFLVLNLKEYLETLERKSFIVFGIIGGVQIFLFLMFKLVFFDLIYDSQDSQ